jgi:hypothetical protein
MPQCFRSSCAMLSLLMLLVVCGMAQADPAQRYRKLDAQERARAADHAREPARAALDRRAARARAAVIRSEVLLIERHRGGKDPVEMGRRLADVYIYDYDADQLSMSVVDLDTDTTISVRVVDGAQLPLIQSEIDRALALVFAEPELADRIRADYARVSALPLEGPEGLKVSGFVFRSDAMPGAHSQATKVCGAHRCAQLLLRTQDEVALELPVVDLSKGLVLDSRSFGINRADRANRRREAQGPSTPHPDAKGREHNHAH